MEFYRFIIFDTIIILINNREPNLKSRENKLKVYECIDLKINKYNLFINNNLDILIKSYKINLSKNSIRSKRIFNTLIINLIISN